MLRLMLCILLVAAVPSSAIAAKRTMSLSQAQTAAAKGDDANVSAALAMTTDRNTCLNGCGSRGYDDAHCKLYCKPGFCHPDEETPYCVGK
jgi:hypothetical protein